MDEKHSSPLGGFPSLLWALFFLVAVAIGVVSMVRRQPAGVTVEGQRAANRVQKREELEKADVEKLTTPAWVDKSKQTVRVPLDRAKKIVAAELVAKKVGPSSVKVELPPPTSPASASSEPSPLRLPSAPYGADLLQFEVFRPAGATDGRPQNTQPPAQPSTTAQ